MEGCHWRPGPVHVTLPDFEPDGVPSSCVVKVIDTGVAVVRAQIGPESPGIHANALTGTQRAGSIQSQLDALTTPASAGGAIETVGRARRLRTVTAARWAS